MGPGVPVRAQSLQVQYSTLGGNSTGGEQEGGQGGDLQAGCTHTWTHPPTCPCVLAMSRGTHSRYACSPQGL